MALVDASCLLGLPPEARQQQFYEALYVYADDDTLVDPECFLSLDRQAQFQAILATVGGETGCAITESDMWAAFYRALYDANPGSLTLDPDCFSGDPQTASQELYRAFYTLAGDDTLTDPACFLGLSQEERTVAMFGAVSAIAGGGAALAPSDFGVLVVDFDPAALALSDAASVPSVTDSSGNNYHAAQAVSASRPTFRANEINGLPAVQFDGTNDFLETPAVPAQAAMTVYIVARSTNATPAYVAEFAGTNNKALVHGYAAQSWEWFATPRTVLAPIRPDTYQIIVASMASSGTALGGKWTLGAAAGSGDPWAGKLARMLVYTGAHTESQQEAVMRYLRTTYGFQAASLPLLDNGYEVFDGNHWRNSALARAVYTTSATSVDIQVYCTLFYDSAALANIGIRVNGADYETVALSNDGTFTLTRALPAGPKTVEIIAGAQNKPGTEVLGVFLRSITFSAAATRVTGNASPRLVVLCDSIGVGANASSPPLNSAWALVRQSYPGSITLDGWGYNSLFAIAGTAEKRAAFIAHLAPQEIDELWCALMTNDFGFSLWSAAEFETGLGLFFDAFHVIHPTVSVRLQLALARTNEGANSQGSTLEAYRDAARAVQVTRSSYISLVDPSGWSIALSDEVHPDTTGHASYAAQILGVLAP